MNRWVWGRVRAVLTRSSYRSNLVLDLGNKFPDMLRRPQQKGQVMPWVDVVGEALFGLEPFLQDLIEVPFTEVRAQKTLLELCIPIRTMLFIGILYLFLVELVSFQSKLSWLDHVLGHCRMPR